LDGAHLDAPMANPKPERIATLLIALTAGKITWDGDDGKPGDFDWSETSPVPRLLSGVFPQEPKWVDLTAVMERDALRTSLSRSNSEFMRAVAQLAAPIRGIDFSRLVSEDFKQHRRMMWTAWAAAAALACLSAAALWQWRTAVAQRDRADQATNDAVTQRDLATAKAAEAKANADKANATLREAQIGQSRSLADQGRQQRALGDGGSAILLALEALPDSAAGIDRPYVPEAELQLDGALRNLRERLVMSTYQDAANNATFSPDGKRIVTASDNKVRIWDAATGRPIGEGLKGHGDAMTRVAFSPDGQRVVTASRDGTALIWDVESGQPIGEPLRGHEDWVASAAFSPDGKRILTASKDGTAIVWDAHIGKPIGQPLIGHGAALYGAAFSPDGKRIVTASKDGTARVWNAESGKSIGKPLNGHKAAVYDAAFSPDGNRIVTASQDGTARIWATKTGNLIGEPLKGHKEAVLSAGFSPDGRRVVTASADKTARV
jgi:WD40 repeat protein